MAGDAPDRFTVRPGAPVSVPIDWKKLNALKSGAAYGIKRRSSGAPLRGRTLLGLRIKSYRLRKRAEGLPPAVLQ
jgi:hypothetical protein